MKFLKKLAISGPDCILYAAFANLNLNMLRNQLEVFYLSNTLHSQLKNNINFFIPYPEPKFFLKKLLNTNFGK